MNVVKFVRARCIYTTHSDFHAGELYRFNYRGSGIWNRYFEGYNAMLAVCGTESRVLYIESSDRIIAVFDVVKECTV